MNPAVREWCRMSAECSAVHRPSGPSAMFAVTGGYAAAGQRPGSCGAGRQRRRGRRRGGERSRLCLAGPCRPSPRGSRARRAPPGRAPRRPPQLSLGHRVPTGGTRIRSREREVESGVLPVAHQRLAGARVDPIEDRPEVLGRHLAVEAEQRTPRAEPPAGHLAGGDVVVVRGRWRSPRGSRSPSRRWQRASRC